MTLPVFLSTAIGFRQYANSPNQIACERRARRDHDSQAAAVGIVETIDAREILFTTAGVEARHDQRDDPLAILRADGIHVDDAGNENLPRTRDRRVPRIRGSP